MVCRNFDKICISLKMGCYLVNVWRHTLEVNLIFNLALKYINRRLYYERTIDIHYLEKINVKASQCCHYFVLRRGFRTVYNLQQCSYTDINFHRAIKEYAKTKNSLSSIAVDKNELLQKDM